MSFLPEKYEVPSSSDKYYKFKQGENKFRIMSSPILGYEYWTGESSNRKPVRYKMDEYADGAKVDASEIKHFWAMIVYDYESEKAKILEVTQKGIQKAIKTLAKDKDWGSPVGSAGYDIVVVKTGEGMDTEYQVNPKPQKKLADGIEEYVKDMNINLEALFTGDDPFNPKQEDIVVPEDFGK